MTATLPTENELGFQADVSEALQTDELLEPIRLYECAPVYLLRLYRQGSQLPARIAPPPSRAARLPGSAESQARETLLRVQRWAPVAMGALRASSLVGSFAMVAANPVALLLGAPMLALTAHRLIGDLRRALVVDPQIRKLMSEARELLSQDEPRKAEGLLKAALEVDLGPENRRNGELWFELGLIYIRQGEFLKGQAAFFRASVLFGESESITQHGVQVNKRGMAELLACACLDSLALDPASLAEAAELIADVSTSATRRFEFFAGRTESGGFLRAADPGSAQFNRALAARTRFLAAKMAVRADRTATAYATALAELREGTALLLADPVLGEEEKARTLLEQANFYLEAARSGKVADLAMLTPGLEALDRAAQIFRSTGSTSFAFRLRANAAQYCRSLLRVALQSGQPVEARWRAEAERRFAELGRDLSATFDHVEEKEAFILLCWEQAYHHAADPVRKREYLEEAIRCATDPVTYDPIAAIHALLRRVYLAQPGGPEHRRELERTAELVRQATADSPDSIARAFAHRYSLMLESPEGRTGLYNRTVQRFRTAAAEILGVGRPVPFLFQRSRVLLPATLSAFVCLHHAAEVAREGNDAALLQQAADDVLALEGLAPRYRGFGLMWKGFARMTEGSPAEARPLLTEAERIFHKFDCPDRQAECQAALEQLADAPTLPEPPSAEVLQQYAALRGQLCGLLAQTEALEETAGLGQQAAVTREERERLLADRFHLAVVGEFSSGKSTLINALLGAAVLPAGSLPTTAVITRIEYGAEPSCQVTPVSGDPYAVPFEALSDVVTELGNEHNEKGVAEVLIRYPLELLKLGVTIIDTPGIGSVIERHTEITYSLIPHCDAVLLLSDCGQLLSESERRFLHDLREQVADKFFFLANKADTLDPDALKRLLAWAEFHLGQEVGSARIFPVSAYWTLYGKLAAAGLADQSALARRKALRGETDAERLQAGGGMRPLEQELRGFLVGRRGQAMLESALGLLGRKLAFITDQAATLAQAQTLSLEELERRSEAVITDLRDRKGQLQELLRHLRESMEQLLADLDSRIRKAAYPLLSETDAFIEQLTADDSATAAVRQFLESRLNEVVRTNLQDLTFQLGNAATEVEAKLLRLCQDADRSFRSSFELAPEPLRELNAVTVGPVRQSELASLADNWVGVGLGAWLGAALLGPIGVVLGAIGTALYGQSQRARQQLDSRQQLRSSAADVVTRSLERFLQQTGVQVRATVGQVEQRLRGRVDTQFASLEQRLREAVREKRAGEAAIQSELSRWTDLGAQARTLAGAAASVGAQVPALSRR